MKSYFRDGAWKQKLILLCVVIVLLVVGFACLPDPMLATDPVP